MFEILKFRELVVSDANSLLEIYSDKEAMKHRGSKPMETLYDAKLFARNKRILKDKILTTRKGIELLKTSELIGSVMYRRNKEIDEKFEIGYSIGRKYWGQGLGYQTVSAMIKELSKKDEIKLLTAWCNKENLASIKILDKLGFEIIEQNVYPKSFLYEKVNKMK